MHKVETAPSPILRWAGGKKWLLKHISHHLKNCSFNNYHEPFLGGGAVFFSCQPEKESFLCDINSELIQTYLAVKENPQDIINLLLNYQNTEQFYYQLRSSEPKNSVEKAARFIFLNQTSYNGLYRVNKLGKYNVPYGFRTNVQIKPERILAASQAFQNSNISSGDFTSHFDMIQSGDLVFLDPPYTVSHNNNGFIEYNKTLFSIDDQKRLSNFIDRIKAKQAFYILTNAAHKTIYEIFNKGDQLIELQRNSLIGGSNSNRGLISEYIFTNLPERIV